MKIKKEYLILGVVIIALVAYLSLRRTDRTHYRLPALAAVPADDITKIQIKGPAATVDLQKTADRWVIAPENYPANADKVKQMLDVIGSLKLTALISESKNYDRYDLTDDRKIAVKAWASDGLKREFDLGKAAPSFKHTFVTVAGDHRVYHARESFRTTFDETLDGLRDKTVLDFEIKDIREIHAAGNGGRQVFRRMDPPAATSAPDASGKAGDTKSADAGDLQPVWQRENGEPIDAADVNRLLTTLAGLECDRYIYDRPKEDLKNPIYTLLLKGTRDYTLTLFARPEKTEGNYPAVSTFNAYPFELTAYRAEDIMKALEKKDETTAGGD